MSDDTIRQVNSSYEMVEAETLIPHPDNPRRGDVPAIEESIRANGFFGSLLVQTSTRHVLIGNHRLRAALNVDLAEVPVVWADVDDAEARRIMLADNRAADLAVYDDTELLALLAGLSSTDAGLDGSLWSTGDLDGLLADLDRPAVPPPDLAGLTPAEREASYAASGIRSIVLPFATDEYREVVLHLGKLRKAWSLETNGEVIVRLAREAAEAC